MKQVYKLFHFLGSVYFAIILITSLALYVIGGTLLESWSDSHLFAAQYTYSHPLFSFLLSLFFINILFSSLRRWPFQRRHIPFLITHLGLLMIIGGVLIKNSLGTQGVMVITEGSASKHLLIPNTFAIRIEDKAHQIHQYPKESIKDLKLKVVSATPHVDELWETFIKGNVVALAGHPLIPVKKWKLNDPWPQSELIKFPEDKNYWYILAIKTDDEEAALQLAYLDFEHKPLLLIIQNSKYRNSLYTFHAQDSIFHQSINKEDLTSLSVFDKGFSGYGIQVNLPLSEPKTTLSKPPQPLAILREQCEIHNHNFASTLLQFIKAPYSHLDSKFDLLFSQIDWKNLPKQEYHGCYWSSLLLKQLLPIIDSEQSLREYLERNKWPLTIPENGNDQELLIALIQQLFLSSPSLPNESVQPPSNEIENALWMKAYLLAYGISKETLLPPFDNVIQEAPIALQTSVRAIHKTNTPTKKLEDNVPAIWVKIENESQKDEITLAYQPTGSGLKWPVLSGKYLVRYQPETREIPYQIRLRQARQINYLHSSQTYSYESDVIIDDQPVTLSMNNVFQTWDGYRFYMSGMSVGSDGLKSVQIVVNHDPAKYLITYPGGILVGLGAVLLFWGRRWFPKAPK